MSALGFTLPIGA
jgi:hypothetical protein